MKVFSQAFICILPAFITIQSTAQDSTAVKFNYSEQRLNQNEILVSIKMKIHTGIKLYALQKQAEDAVYSGILFDSSFKKIIAGPVTEKGNINSVKDSTLNATVRYYTDSAEWDQKIKAGPADSLLLKGRLDYLYKKADEYIQGQEKFRIFIQPEKAEIKPESLISK